jgi:hypothetical protein
MYKVMEFECLMVNDDESFKIMWVLITIVGLL